MEDIRRRFLHMVPTGTHDEEVQKIFEIKLAYTRSTSSTKLEAEPEETQAEILTVPETQRTRETLELVNESRKYRSPSEPNTMLDRIRKWSLKYNGDKDSIQFVERAEQLSDMSNMPRTPPRYRGNNKGWKDWPSVLLLSLNKNTSRVQLINIY